MILPKRFDLFPPLTGGCSEDLDAFRLSREMGYSEGLDAFRLLPVNNVVRDLFVYFES